MFCRNVTDNHELTAQSETALRIGILMFPLVGAQIIICQFFQSIGKAGIASSSPSHANCCSCFRDWQSSLHWGVNGVWYSMPTSDFFAAAAAILMLFYQIRKFKTTAPFAS